MSFFTPAPEPPTELGRLRILSSTAGVRVSPLQLGAMSIGEGWKDTMGSINKEQSFKLLDAFVEAGGNFIDTASNYQNEQSEAWIGEWMTARKNRDQIVLATKFSADYKKHEVGQGPKLANYAGNHRHAIRVTVRDSLAKLQTDYIDILYLHYWEWTTSIKEVMDSLHILVEQGKVLYLGISNTPAWIVSAANTYAIEHGKTPFSIYQGRWNVMRRDIEREILPMARHFGMAIAPWDVIGGGKFKTQEEVKKRKDAGEPLRSVVGVADQTADEIKTSEALAKVASEHGIKSLSAIALAYVMSKAPRVFPIVGGRKIEHLHDNIQALSIKLTDAQIEYLESVQPLDVGYPHNITGPDPNVTGSSRLLQITSQVKFPAAHNPGSI